MKKRLLAVLMAALLAMTFVACGGETVTEDATIADAVVETEVAADEDPAAVFYELFSSALAGADEAENTYWFLFDDEVSIGAFVILSADYTESVNVVGAITEDEAGVLTITDAETEDSISFSVVEEGDDYLTVAIEANGAEVTLMAWDFAEVVDTILAIDETTEILN